MRFLIIHHSLLAIQSVTDVNRTFFSVNEECPELTWSVPLNINIAVVWFYSLVSFKSAKFLIKIMAFLDKGGTPKQMISRKSWNNLKNFVFRSSMTLYLYTVKPLITNTSKEFIKCRILHFLIMECCRYLVFNKMIIWNSLKLFPHIHGYLFIFANTEISLI